ncbi:GATA transcription factor 26-like isoform X3 [Cucurbita pepo subsp. pepo]|uniref:GATA transcription factor 26-like isoform X3 n=1 Tax=Cucurbita pepo subsp. pepo TaxID=3664 RepID=UPI000C9D5BC0|nr:GATA transcription factor 26-like isoform X3 [Cucurbita pepo subsp. pepo]
MFELISELHQRKQCFSEAHIVSSCNAGTPLWRNGPPDKPVLCNACGSRWRTKGSLANYTPLHARADPDEYDDKRLSRLKNSSVYKNKEVKLLKRKHYQDHGVVVGVIPDHAQSFHKAVDEDTSNRSSSGSAISNSESCAQFGGADGSDLTGPSQSTAWESMVPSRKRTCVDRPKSTAVEKLTKDLYTILREQQSYFSGSSEEDLLFESETPMVSVEIGHGSILMRHPSSIAREEESEASSISVDHKHFSVNEAYSESSIVPSTLGIGRKHSNGQAFLQEQIKKDRPQSEKVQALGNHNSPLCNIDLTIILNFREFTKQLTSGDQRELMKYLPSVDTEELPDSLNSMFESPQFKENLNSFKQLLTEGVFDFSFPGAKREDCKMLSRLVLWDLSKSKWVEQYDRLKKCSTSFVDDKRLLDGQNKKFSETRITMTSPRRVTTKTSVESKELVDDSFCFSPRSLFALPSDGSSFTLESLHFDEDSFDQDLLLDVRSNSSFPQAELLSFGGEQASNSSSSINLRLMHR